ncbi:MAG: hypothetical protein KKD00_04150 [Gammaproteobacteria bacterium]|nr:hypothetical protein [Gammaproteobacteria bacterium]
MIGKLLLTLLVIALVVIYLRKQHQNRQLRSVQPTVGGTGSTLPARRVDRGELEKFLDRARSSNSGKTTAGAGAMAPRIKAVLWSVLLVLLLVGGIGSYLHWQDQQRLVTVLLHRDAGQPPVIYRVAKRNLGVGSFTTEDGTLVTVSASERMEVVGL